MVGRLLVLSLLVAGLAGCAGSDPEPPVDAAEAALEELGLEATATTGLVRGIVLDEAIRPLSGAHVQLVGLEASTTTNDDGAFGFDGLKEGAYSVEVSLAEFLPTRQEAQVVAGVQDPPILRVVLAAAPRTTPYISEHHVTLFTFASYMRQTSTGSLGNPFDDSEYKDFEIQIEPYATVGQAEFVWKATTGFGPNLWVRGGARAAEATVNTSTVEGPSPLLHRARTVGENGTADHLRYLFQPGDSHLASIPVGVMLNQKVDAYVHVFYNFDPDPEWRFSRDGRYQVPQ